MKFKREKPKIFVPYSNVVMKLFLCLDFWANSSSYLWFSIKKGV